jgi:hypothetical protein
MNDNQNYVSHPGEDIQKRLQNHDHCDKSENSVVQYHMKLSLWNTLKDNTQKASRWNRSNIFPNSEGSKIEEDCLVDKMEKVGKELRWYLPTVAMCVQTLFIHIYQGI